MVWFSVLMAQRLHRYDHDFPVPQNHLEYGIRRLAVSLGRSRRCAVVSLLFIPGAVIVNLIGAGLQPEHFVIALSIRFCFPVRRW